MSGKIRVLNSYFWDDTYIRKSSKDVKLVYAYLLTNSFTNMMGLYEIDIDQIAFSTNIKREEAAIALNALESDNKIIYKEGYVMIKNWHKYQTSSPSIKIAAARAFNSVPDSVKALFSNGQYPTDITPDEVDQCIQAMFNYTPESVLKPKPDRRKPRGPIVITPPSVDEVVKYFVDNGYKEAAARKAYKYYETAEPPWTDANGNPIRVWKQKMNMVWFKEENRDVVVKPKKFVPGPDDVLELGPIAKSL
jgi:hypothetical protein